MIDRKCAEARLRDVVIQVGNHTFVGNIDRLRKPSLGNEVKKTTLNSEEGLDFIPIPTNVE